MCAIMQIVFQLERLRYSSFITRFLADKDVGCRDRDVDNVDCFQTKKRGVAKRKRKRLHKVATAVSMRSELKLRKKCERLIEAAIHKLCMLQESNIKSEEVENMKAIILMNSNTNINVMSYHIELA